MSDHCAKCIDKHPDFRSEAGHLMLDPETGMTVLEPHAQYSISYDAETGVATLTADDPRKERLIALEARALARVKRRQVSITVAEVLDRPHGRVQHWKRLTAEAQRLADTLWMARVNPRVLEASRA